FVKPFVLKDGFEYWTVASWDKKSITHLYKKIEKTAERATIELVSLNEEPANLFVPDVLQQLSGRQFEALSRAVDDGYYGYPRKTDLGKMAKKMKISPSALREHLRLAESKLLPVALRQFQRA
ncbi:MAG: helix-turn-helix domain-containing protein, partial [Candidatus Micrarchaeota archaeon]